MKTSIAEAIKAVTDTFDDVVDKERVLTIIEGIIVSSQDPDSCVLCGRHKTSVPDVIQGPTKRLVCSECITTCYEERQRTILGLGNSGETPSDYTFQRNRDGR